MRNLSEFCLVIPMEIALFFVLGCGGGASPNQVHNEWTWVSGSTTFDEQGVYGTQGASSAANIPSARELSSCWTDSAGNFWFFGGTITPTGGIGVDSQGNDLWKYDTTSQQWTWVSGSSAANQPGIYGTRSVASKFNVPGARESSSSWTDSAGNFWLFGGIGYDSTGTYAGDMNDLWKFNSADDTWTWVSGSNLNEINSSMLQGMYGIQGTPNPANLPGMRDGASEWIDRNGNLWLFGGMGFDSSGTPGALNDLWEFNPATNMWTWISGSSTVYATGVYGTQGSPAATNVPQARERAAQWTDNTGSLWLFGGIGWSSAMAGGLNDLWKFDPGAGMWTWMSGSKTLNATGVYGTLSMPAVSNVPGGRQRSISWTDNSGNFWLYGGMMNGGGDFTDVWKYSPATNMWTWIGGTITPEFTVYGTQGIPSASNIPGKRTEAASWMDKNGDLWMFGGLREETTGSGLSNDLWKYQP